MGDVDSGEAGFLDDAADFGAHFGAELGVEIGEGFVEEKCLGADDEGAGEGDALLLAAGELVDSALGVLRHFDGFQRSCDAVLDLGLVDFSFFETEGDVFGDGHVWPEGVALEHHGGVPFVRGDVRHLLHVEEEMPGIGSVESCDVAEEGRLSAAGGTEEKEEFTGFDFERDIIESGGVAEVLRQIARNNRDHVKGESRGLPTAEIV